MPCAIVVINHPASITPYAMCYSGHQSPSITPYAMCYSGHQSPSIHHPLCHVLYIVVITQHHPFCHVLYCSSPSITPFAMFYSGHQSSPSITPYAMFYSGHHPASPPMQCSILVITQHHPLCNVQYWSPGVWVSIPPGIPRAYNGAP